MSILLAVLAVPSVVPWILRDLLAESPPPSVDAIEVAIAIVVGVVYAVWGLYLHIDLSRRPFLSKYERYFWFHIFFTGVGGIFYHFIYIRPEKQARQAAREEDGGDVPGPDQASPPSTDPNRPGIGR